MHSPELAPITDQRTTPKWLRIPGLLLLAVVTGYMFLCYSIALDDERPAFVEQYPYSLWMGTWKMFTIRERYITIVEADLHFEGNDQWQRFDLDELFPYHWESGPRYVRSPFRNSTYKMKILAQSTCSRYVERYPDASLLGVRLRVVRWRKTLGSYTQPRNRDLRTGVAVVWNCTDQVPLPYGRRI